MAHECNDSYHLLALKLLIYIASDDKKLIREKLLGKVCDYEVRNLGSSLGLNREEIDKLIEITGPFRAMQASGSF